MEVAAVDAVSMGSWCVNKSFFSVLLRRTAEGCVMLGLRMGCDVVGRSV